MTQYMYKDGEWAWIARGVILSFTHSYGGGRKVYGCKTK